MSSFIFNNFKKRFLNGEVATSDKWTFIPVNSNFIDGLTGDNIKPEQFRTEKEIKEYLENKAKNYNQSKCKMYAQDLDYYKLEEVKYTNKPLFVTRENYTSFLGKFSNQGNLGQLFFQEGGLWVGRTVDSGFYFVRTKEELKWCADRVNGLSEDGQKSDSYNNYINIVLGDDIGEDNLLTEINFSIGKFSDRPFEGVFFGNGYVFKNLKFKVTDEVGGIFGYVGRNAYLSHINVYGNTEVVCEKKINLSHIKSSANDVCFGVIAAKNYGYIENCRYSLKLQENKNTSNQCPTVTFKGFVPQVYLVQNKTENTDTPVSEDKTNKFFPSYLCINSPGNIVPYVGYFAEGVPSVSYDHATHKNGNWWLNETTPMNSDWTDTKCYMDSYSGYYKPTDDTIGAQYLMDGSNIQDICNRLGSNISASEVGIDSFFDRAICNTDMDKLNWRDNRMSNPWSDHSIKMHQFARSAYYISPFCGWNRGTIKYCESRAIAKFAGTFVGFCGGLVGKMAGGIIQSCNTYLQPTDDETCSRNIFVSSASDSVSDQNLNYISINKSVYDQTLGFSGENTVSFSGDVAIDVINCPSGEELPVEERFGIYDQYMSTDYYARAVIDVDDKTVGDEYMDRFGAHVCPWFNSLNTLAFQFEGVNSTSGSQIIHEITFSGATSSGTSACQIVSDYLNKEIEDSFDFSAADYTVKSSVIPMPPHIIHCKRFSEGSMNKVANAYGEPCYTEWHAAWFPMLKDSTQVFNEGEYEFDATVGAYVVKNVKFKFSYGYTVVTPSAYFGDQQYGPDGHKGWPSEYKSPYLVDAVYPDFYNRDDEPLNATSKQTRMTYINPNTGTRSLTEWRHNTFYYGDTELSAFEADDNKITTGYEILDGAADKYQNTIDDIRPFLLNPVYTQPTITIDKMYLRPLAVGKGRFNSSPNTPIEKLVDKVQPNYYINGQPMCVYKVQGMHIKTTRVELQPRTNKTTEHTRVLIRKYETVINELAYNLNNGKTTPDEFTYLTNNTDTPTEVKTQRSFIWDCADLSNLNNVFDLEQGDNAYNNYALNNWLIHAYIEQKGESFISELQSIYNIGAIAASIVASPSPTYINNTSAFLDNKISEGLAYTNSAMSAYDFDSVDSKNYSFLNRFGTLAAIYELNTSNMCDAHCRPIVCTDNYLQYEEETAGKRMWDLSAYSGIGRDFYGPIQANGSRPDCPFGIGSPLVAEIKPTYNAFPQINSFIGQWYHPGLTQKDVGSVTDYEGKSFYGMFTHDLNLMYNQFNDGIYTMDMNVDTPIENNWFRKEKYFSEWCPKTNSPDLKDAYGTTYAGFPWLAEKLFQGNHYKQAYYGVVHTSANGKEYIEQGPGWRRDGGVFSTVHYPNQIVLDCDDNTHHSHVVCAERTGRDSGFKMMLAEWPANGIVYDTAKHESNYSIFGSSLKVMADASGKQVTNDLLISFETFGGCHNDCPDLSNVKMNRWNKDYFKANEKEEYFTYTYSANYDKVKNGYGMREVGPLVYDVTYERAEKNGRIGYWLQDPVIGIKGDGVEYEHNVIHYGLTKHPYKIREEILKNKVSKTSGISAEDFQGLYVIDNQGNNVMYVDTGIGNLNGLQAWSWALTSNGEKDDNKKGLILGIN